MGVVYYLSRKFTSALSAFQEAIRMDPNNGLWHYWVGITNYQLKEYTKALAELQQSDHLLPNQSETYFFMGAVYVNGLKQYDKAVAVLSKAVRLNPNHAGSHDDLGFAYYKLGQLQKALDEAKQAVRLKPDNPNYQFDLGMTYVALEKLQEAREVSEVLAKLDKDQAAELNDEIETESVLNEKSNTRPQGANPSKAQNGPQRGTQTLPFSTGKYQRGMDLAALKQLSEEGDAEAQNALGFRYENGMKVEKNASEARKWYLKAANQGLAAGQMHVCSGHLEHKDLEAGVYPFSGLPLPPLHTSKADLVEALKWCGKAASQGYVDAEADLGILYAKGGEGLKRDYEQSYFWLKLDQQDRELCDAVANQLTPAQRARIEKKLKQWISDYQARTLSSTQE
jgi:TPR repeat protein